ncbi:hypothetical protein A3SI_07299 [Nitritalea halalkaliphila LW7]|uniref:Uncharacterized protein n=1 Tax=Nitritalea halalkaliphila LW7 TaxID=1189621 RepID=I5C5J6_9BACT|nr:hypothetical protein A3SI_07299 [Nitritalea halalkaliphila LW7]
MLNVRTLVLFLSLVGLFSQCKPSSPYSPEQLSSREQHSLLLSSIRYLGHLPKKANHDTKFQPVYDTYYSQLALDYTVEAYFQDDTYEYFLASRIAPSLKVKKSRHRSENSAKCRWPASPLRGSIPYLEV